LIVGFEDALGGDDFHRFLMGTARKALRVVPLSLPERAGVRGR
jgi:hypothetical protein